MITAVLSGSHPRRWESVLEGLLRNPLVRKAVVLHTGEPGICPPRCERLAVDGPVSGKTWNVVLSGIATRYILFSPDTEGIRLDPRAPERLVETAEATGAGMVYADYCRPHRETPSGNIL